jgi:TPR repeat protein
MFQHYDTDLDEDDAQPRRRGPWRLILIVAVLTLVAVFLVPSEAPRETAPEPTASADDTGSAPPSLLDAPPAPVESAAIAVPPAAPTQRAQPQRQPGELARERIAEMRRAGDVDLDRVVAMAREQQAAGAGMDAYLLLFFAAREGHPAAALALGEQADPAHHDANAGMPGEPDPMQAYKWYREAADAGEATAGQRLQALRERIERRAAEGDAEAQRMTLLWR